jgi:hypothetical protein
MDSGLDHAGGPWCYSLFRPYRSVDKIRVIRMQYEKQSHRGCEKVMYIKIQFTNEDKRFIAAVIAIVGIVFLGVYYIANHL